MIKDTIKTIPFTALLLVYLFACGVLYIIGYWSTFKIDVFSLISIYDIPKNFVFPLLISQGFFTLQLIIGNIAPLNDDRRDISHFITIKNEWSRWKRIILAILTSIDLWLFCSIYLLWFKLPNAPTNIIFWGVAPLMIAFYLMHRFVNYSEVKAFIKPVILRAYVAYILIFFPITCFSTGKLSSLNILNNKEIDYINIIDKSGNSLPKDSTQYKFLGFVGNKVIYSSFDNKNTYIVNQSSFNGVVFKKKQ